MRNFIILKLRLVFWLIVFSHVIYAQTSPVISIAKKEISYSRHQTDIAAVAFSPDGKKLASAGGDRVKVTDLVTGKEILKLKNSRGMNFYGTLFSSDGRWLIGCQSKLKDRKVFQQGDITTISFFHIGETIVWNAETGAVKAIINDNNNPVWQLALSPDGKTLAMGIGPTPPPNKDCRKELCNGSGEVLLVDTHTWEIRTRLTGKSQAVRLLTFSPDGKWLAGSNGGLENRGFGVKEFEALIWNVATGKLQERLPHHGRFVTAIAFSPNNKWVATASIDRTLRIWDVETMELVRTTSEYVISYDELETIANQSGKKNKKDVLPKSSWLSGLVFLPDNKTIIGSGGDGILRFYDAESGKLRRIIKPHDWPIISWDLNWDSVDFMMFRHFYRSWSRRLGVLNSMVLSPDAKILATGAADGKIRLFSLD